MFLIQAKNQKLLNNCKILSIHFLHMAFLFLLFLYLEVNIYLILGYLVLFYIYFSLLNFNLKKWISFFTSEITLRPENEERILLQIETISNKIGLPVPTVIILDIESYIFFSMGFSKRSGYFIFVGKNVLKNNTLVNNLDYLLANQLYLMSTSEVSLVSNLSFVFAWPILVLDLLLIKMMKFHLDFFGIVLKFIFLPLYAVIYLINYIYISRNRIFMADFFSSKLLKRVSGFSDSLEIFRSIPNYRSEFIPLSLQPLFFARPSNQSVLPGLFSFAPTTTERIESLRSIIG